MNLYTIYDIIAHESGPVFQAKNDGVALRQFQNLVGRDGLNPDEYSLHCLGTYDPENMLILVHDPILVERLKDGK